MPFNTLNYRRRRREFGYTPILNYGTSNQTFGAEVIVNGNFSAWTLDDPDSWAVSLESAGTREIQEVGPGENKTGTGTGAVNFWNTSGSTFAPRMQQNNVFTSVAKYQVRVKYWQNAATNFVLRALGGTALQIKTFTATGNYSFFTDQDGTRGSFQFLGSSSTPTNQDYTFDDLSVKIVTLNTQQTTLANADNILYFTLPLAASAETDSSIELQYRIVDTSNDFQAILTYNGTNWQASLIKIVAGVITTLISATTAISGASVGASTIYGLMVKVNGNNHSLYFINGANPPTQIGTTITDTSHNTATGINFLHSEGIVFNHLYSYNVGENPYGT